MSGFTRRPPAVEHAELVWEESDVRTVWEEELGGRLELGGAVRIDPLPAGQPHAFEAQRPAIAGCSATPENLNSKSPMPRAKPEKPQPFTPVDDPPELSRDPVNSRVVQLFDSLRRRGVGPERAAYVVSQVHASSSNNAHPISK